MRCQMTPATESLPANITLKRFLPGVDTVMIGQMTPLNERLPTNITSFVQFLPGMDTVMIG